MIVVRNGEVFFSRLGTKNDYVDVPFQIPQQAASTRISARFVDNTAIPQTCRVKVYGHVYDTSV